MTDNTAVRNRIAAPIRILLPLVGISALVNVLMLTGSIYMLQIYDRVLTSGSVPTLVALFGIVVVLYGFLAFYDMLRLRVLSRAAIRLDARMGEDAFRASLRGGNALRDLETLRAGLASPLMTALLDLPFVPLFLGVLFLLHPWLGWMALAGAVLSTALALLTRRIATPAQGRALRAETVERRIADASAAAPETVAVMGLEAPLKQRWREMRDANLAAAQSGAEPGDALAAVSRSFRMLLQSAILTLGAYLVIAGDITAGMIIASSILSGRALAPIDQVVGQWRQLGRMAAARRSLSDALAGLGAEAPALRLPRPAGDLSVRDLTFLAPAPAGLRPGASPPRILSDISFHIDRGDVLAVQGASASGKTTLARLLVGGLAPDGGSVRLDGAELGQWPPAERARIVGYLPQAIAFLPGTIRDNICRFDPEAEDEEVLKAAERAGVHRMILSLPGGYGTLLGTGAEAPLSGGQMQRLALARAIYGSPALLVLDEPNSHLDVSGEHGLIAAIEDLSAEGTSVVVISHRPDVLAVATHVLQLAEGRIASFARNAHGAGLAATDTHGAPVRVRFGQAKGENGRVDAARRALKTGAPHVVRYSGSASS